jgi:UPF0716 family protein affecting phage T7 exclusion
MEINDQIAELFGFVLLLAPCAKIIRRFAMFHSSFFGLNLFAESFKANKRKMKLFGGSEKEEERAKVENEEMRNEIYSSSWGLQNERNKELFSK